MRSINPHSADYHYQPEESGISCYFIFYSFHARVVNMLNVYLSPCVFCVFACVCWAPLGSGVLIVPSVQSPVPCTFIHIIGSVPLETDRKATSVIHSRERKQTHNLQKQGRD